MSYGEAETSHSC